MTLFGRSRGGGTSIKAPGGTANAPYVKLDPSQGGDPAVVQERNAYAQRQHWLMRQLRRNKSAGLRP